MQILPWRRTLAQVSREHTSFCAAVKRGLRLPQPAGEAQGLFTGSPGRRTPQRQAVHTHAKAHESSARREACAGDEAIGMGETPLAALLARIFEVLPLVCPRCGGGMRSLAFLTEAFAWGEGGDGDVDQRTAFANQPW
jgi:hypothetical protein